MRGDCSTRIVKIFILTVTVLKLPKPSSNIIGGIIFGAINRFDQAPCGFQKGQILKVPLQPIYLNMNSSVSKKNLSGKLCPKISHQGNFPVHIRLNANL